MAQHFKSPLTLYVLWHPKFSDGAKLADRLFNTLSRNVDDPFTRSIGIPVYYRSQPANSGSEAPAPIDLDESDYNAIVVFVDTRMLLSKDWTEYVKALLANMAADPAKTRVFPMANDFAAFKSKELGAINYIRMFEADDRDDVGMVGEDSARVDEAAVTKIVANLREREASLQAREAMLAERERAVPATDAAPGVSVGVGQPTVQGNGININITINQPDSASSAGQPVGVTHDHAIADAAAQSSATASELDFEQTVAMAAAARTRSAEEILHCRGNLMISKLVHELCRLIVSPPKVTEAGTTTSAKPVHLFLSHAKADGAEIAKQIKNYIEEDSSMKTFFDANDIAPGYMFSDELKGAIEKSALICIQTDYYATREWCLFEVITAKRFDRPVVVLNAVQQREPRSFPYIGNVPTMRWNPNDKSRFREVVDLALLEVLAITYSEMFQRALLKLYQLPGADSRTRSRVVHHSPFTQTASREGDRSRLRR